MKIDSLFRTLRNAGVLAATALCLAVPAMSEPPAVESVASVDLKRFSGQWYEIAHLPNRFQADCVSDTTASYRQLPDGSLEVINRCREGVEKWNTAEGVAVPAEGSNSWARLKVTFLPEWLQWLPIGRGDLWVVMLEKDYRYAVLSDPSRQYLWILSRSSAMDDATYRDITARLSAGGYPVQKLVRTPHQPRPSTPAYAAGPIL
jgi:apolipoprotein D and lipocalin family protein